ncbi:MAG: VTC domain-containing protein [Gemmiger sp.]
MPQFTFERVEKKYLLTPQQLNTLQPALLEHMQPDEYGRHTICNLYYDTPDYRLIRTSLQKPLYKEKLRLRSYGTPRPGDPVFAELKKKYRGVVYKRRTELELTAAERWLSGDAPARSSRSGGRSTISTRSITRGQWYFSPTTASPCSAKKTAPCA